MDMDLGQLWLHLGEMIKNGASTYAQIKFVDGRCNKNPLKNSEIKYHTITDKYKVPTLEITLDIPLTADEVVEPLRITTGTW